MGCRKGARPPSNHPRVNLLACLLHMRSSVRSVVWVVISAHVLSLFRSFTSSIRRSFVRAVRRLFVCWFAFVGLFACVLLCSFLPLCLHAFVGPFLRPFVPLFGSLSVCPFARSHGCPVGPCVVFFGLFRAAPCGRSVASTLYLSCLSLSIIYLLSLCQCSG